MDFFVKQIDSWIANLLMERTFITDGCLPDCPPIYQEEWDNTEFVEVVHHDIKTFDSKTGRKFMDVFIRYVEKE